MENNNAVLDASNEPESVIKQLESFREHIKGVADALRKYQLSRDQSALKGEIGANVVLSFRHLEDASMRLGKAIQAADGGVSVYDRTKVVGA